MSANERDTHFANFAKLLWQELLYVKGGYIDVEDFSYHGQNQYPEYEKVIAQRAYDLVRHALDTSGIYLHPDPLGAEYIADTDEIIKSVTDLTEWPKSS